MSEKRSGRPRRKWLGTLADVTQIAYITAVIAAALAGVVTSWRLNGSLLWGSVAVAATLLLGILVVRRFRATPATRALWAARNAQQLAADRRRMGNSVLNAIPRNSTLNIEELSVRLEHQPDFEQLSTSERIELIRFLRESGNTPGMAGAETALAIPEDHLAHKRMVEIRGKHCAAELALKHVRDGNVIAIDGGSSTQIFTELLADEVEHRRFRNLTVVTNSLPVLRLLLECLERLGYGDNESPLRLVSCAGILRPNTQALAELSRDCPITIPSFRGILANIGQFDLAIVGANGVTYADGITMPTEFELPVKRYMIEQSVETVVLVDSTKFGFRYSHQILAFDGSESFSLVSDAPQSENPEFSHIVNVAAQSAHVAWTIETAVPRP